MSQEVFVAFQSLKAPEGVSTPITFRRAGGDGNIINYSADIPFTPSEARRLQAAHEHAAVVYSDYNPVPWYGELGDRAGTITRIRELLPELELLYREYMSARAFRQLSDKERAFNLLFLSLSWFGQQETQAENSTIS